MFYVILPGRETPAWDFLFVLAVRKLRAAILKQGHFRAEELSESPGQFLQTVFGPPPLPEIPICLPRGKCSPFLSQDSLLCQAIVLFRGVSPIPQVC